MRCLCKAGSACEGSCRQETQAEVAGQARGARSIPRLSEWYTSRMSAALTSTAFSATLPLHSYSCRARALLRLRRPFTSQGIQQSSCRTHSRQRSTRLQSSDKPALDSADRQSLGVASAGEDAAFFDASKQSRGAWTFFTAELAIVLGILYVVRLCPAWFCLQPCTLFPKPQGMLPSFAYFPFITSSFDLACC